MQHILGTESFTTKIRQRRKLRIGTLAGNQKRKTQVTKMAADQSSKKQKR
jgi:hypothetical protein